VISKQNQKIVSVILNHDFKSNDFESFPTLHITETRAAGTQQRHHRTPQQQISCGRVGYTYVQTMTLTADL